MPDDTGAMPPPDTCRSIRDIALALLGHVLGGTVVTGPQAGFLASHAAALPDPAQALARLSDLLSKPIDDEQPLGRLADNLSLTPPETVAIALLLAVETESLTGQAVSWVQAPLGGARPTLGLLAGMLAPLWPAQGLVPLLAGGEAVRSGLCRLEGTGPLPERMLCLPDGLIAALTGAALRWPGLSLPDRSSGPWPQSLADALDPIARAMAKDPRLLLIVRGASPDDRAEVIFRVARAIGLTPAMITLAQTEVQGLGPLCAAAGLLPGIRVQPGAGEYQALPDLPGHTGPVIAFIGPEGDTGRTDLRALEWSVPMPTPDERAALWREAFPDGPIADKLGAEHLQSAGRIREIGRAATAIAGVEGHAPDAKSLRAALWAGGGEGLGALAQPVKDVIPDEALVVAPPLRADLEVLLARCRGRERLTDGLGPAIAARYKLGVKALFTGPSGTGKTMGAAWLAGRLTLPLYRVDLASVVSKYIGETEKNLAQLLARAEEQEVVLLFDEADSLFGKRTEVSDSNDRFANAQTNYLLQRIETYSGIVLLTSNARNRFDEAFTRRIDLIVEFQAPQPGERLALWLAHLGAAHDVGAGDLNRLAAMAELAGGHIRNVVLMGAVLAREAERPLGYDHLLAGLKAEYRKLGWTVPAELLQDIR